MGFLDKLLGKATKDQFAQIVTEEIKNLQPDKKITYHNDESYALEIEGGHLVYLSNMYNDYCRAPRREKPNVIALYLATLADSQKHDSPEYFETGRDRFFPHVRSAVFFTITRLMLKARNMEQDFDYPSRPLCGDMFISLVIDSPTSVASVTQSNLRKWNKSFEEVEAAAIENLFSFTSGELQQIEDGVYTAPWADIFNATRILLPHLFQNLKIMGDPVVLIPTRESLFVTGSENGKGLAALPALGEKAVETGRQMSAKPLVFRNGTWAPFELEPNHPAYRDFQMMRIRELLGDYTEQGRLLEPLEGEEFYIAKFNATQKQDTGEISSYAVWTKDVPTLLPVAHRVSFVKGPGDVTMYNWSDVQEVCGHLMEPCGLHPERYRVRTFPDDFLLNQMLKV